MPAIARWFGCTVMTAVAFALTGRVALLLAIPPGFATPVWPAAGIALYAVLRGGNSMAVGVVLGSFLVNTWQCLEADRAISLALPLGIGLGSAAQALIGAALIRRFVGFPTNLLHGSDVCRFLLLGGPLACLLNGLFGPVCLSLAGVNPWQNYFVNAGYWWFGDTLGVVLTVPILLALFAERKSIWRGRIRTVSIPTLITFAGIVLIFDYARAWERHRVGSEFERRANDVSHALGEHLVRYLDVLDTIESYYAASQFVSRQEFRTFVRSALERYPGLAALSWNQRVQHADRAAFERSVRADGYGDFRIRHRSENGDLIVARTRPEYVPVTYVEPIDGNRAALGFDVASDEVRADALRRAREGSAIAATHRIRLVQAESERFGVLICKPIFGSAPETESPERKTKALSGYAVAVLKLHEMATESFAGVDLSGLELRLIDVSAPTTEQLLYARDEGIDHQRSESSAAEAIGGRALGLQHESLQIVGDRVWKLQVTPTLGFLVAQQTWHAWLVLAGGLMFASLLCSFLLVISGRGSLDAERAEELAAANDELVHRSEDMEEVMHTVSHDLKTPLVTLSGFSAIANRAVDDGDYAKATDAVRRISSASQRMGMLVDDLVELNRIGRVHAICEPVDTAEVERELVELLELQLRAKEVDLRLEGPMPLIRIDPIRLSQVLQNLLENALRYGCQAASTVVRVGAQETGHEIQIFVADDGPGIPERHHERIFGLFQRLHSDRDGTGVGLAIVAKIMKSCRGRCWVESEEGHGARFCVAFPIELFGGWSTTDRSLHRRRPAAARS